MSDDSTPSEGICVVIGDDDSLRHETLEQAMDYRGDVTVVCRDSREIVGYLFDASTNGYTSIDLTDGGRTKISIDDITEVRFSGRDTAAGKGFDRWIKRYIEKTLAGEAAGIDCEKID